MTPPVDAKKVVTTMRTVLPRSRVGLILTMASAVTAITVFAVTADRRADQSTITTTVATRQAVTVGTGSLAPACPPALPTLEGQPLTTDGTATKPIAAERGRQLTLKARIPATDPDRHILSFTIYLLPSGTAAAEPAKPVSQSPTLRLMPDQQEVSPVLQIPAGLAPGVYQVYGYATGQAIL